MNKKNAKAKIKTSFIPLVDPDSRNNEQIIKSVTVARRSNGTLPIGPRKTYSVPGLFPATHISMINAAMPAITHRRATG